MLWRAPQGLAVQRAKNLPARRSRQSPVFSTRFRRNKKSGRRDSNPRHPAWEASALPTELRPRVPVFTGKTTVFASYGEAQNVASIAFSPPSPGKDLGAKLTLHLGAGSPACLLPGLAAGDADARHRPPARRDQLSLGAHGDPRRRRGFRLAWLAWLAAACPTIIPAKIRTQAAARPTTTPARVATVVMLRPLCRVQLRRPGDRSETALCDPASRRSPTRPSWLRSSRQTLMTARCRGCR